MVVLDDLGLRVQIVVNGSSAEEFLSDNLVGTEKGGVGSSPSVCHRYIESIANANFHISLDILDANGSIKDWINANEENAVRFTISIDGHFIDTTWLSHQKRRAVFRSVRDYKNNTERRFQFSAISIIEDATKELEAKHTEQFKDLGTIQVGVHRSVRFQKFDSRSHGNNRSGSTSDPFGAELARSDEIALAEKALKGRALAHGANLGSASKWRPPTPRNGTHTSWKWVDEKSAPLVVFKFMYRSKDALKQERVIPRTPSPEPSPSPEPPNVDNFSQEEVRRLAQERLSDLQDRKRAAEVKNERQDSSQSIRPLKYVRLSGGRQAIDLTQDD